MLSAAKKAPAGQTLRTARRRLSVVSDNKLVEGLSALGIKDFDGAAGSQAPTNSYKRFYGVTKKGYAPYNPRKRNQDSLMMAEHKDTHSLLVGVFDGHGEAGDLVSRYFTDRLPAALYKNPLFASDPTQALVEELDKIEQLLLTGACSATGCGPGRLCPWRAPTPNTPHPLHPPPPPPPHPRPSFK
jgi:hypothetical protein